MPNLKLNGPSYAGMYMTWEESEKRPLPNAVKNYIDARIKGTCEKKFKETVDKKMEKLKAIANQILVLQKKINQEGAVLQSMGKMAGRELWSKYFEDCAKLKELWAAYSVAKQELYGPYAFKCEVKSADFRTDYNVNVYMGFRGTCQDAINWGI